MPALVPSQETCPLCGATFDAAAQGCRPSCPLAKGCHVVCCPSCGYSFPQEAGLAGGLRRFLDRWKAQKEKGKGDEQVSEKVSAP